MPVATAPPFDKNRAMAVCTRHKDQETGLSCSACERPFCYACLIAGPVGSKCRDCTKGIPIGVSSKERTSANVAHAAKDRYFALKGLMAVLLTVDVLNIVASQSGAKNLSLLSDFGLKYAMSAGEIQNGEFWRLFTGSMVNGSFIVTAITLALVWWLGRQIAPQTRHIQFLAIVLASLGGGVIAMLVGDPAGFTFGGLSLVGGFGATYWGMRKRNLVGKLAIPNVGQYVFFLFFIGSTIFSALTSESGGLLAAGGGAVAAGFVSWLMLDPTRPTTSKRPTAIGAAMLGLALFAGGALSTFATKERQTEMVRGRTDLQKVFEQMMADEQSPTGGEWVTVRYWEEKTDLGDYQTYHVQCTPKPQVRVVAPITKIDPVGVCSWLGEHQASLHSYEPSNCQADVVVWRYALEGTFRGTEVMATFDGGEGCASALSISADNVLAQQVS
jgi:hypothetical protein